MFTEGRVEKFLRKLAGMADLESALKKLDRLTQEEARMALAEVLRITHSVHDQVKLVDGKVENMADKVQDIGESVADLGEEVADLSDKMEDVGEKVEDIGDKVEDIGTGMEDIGDKVDVIGGRVEDICDELRDVGNKVEDVGKKVEDVGGKVEDVGNKVEDIGDQVQFVNENVQVVVNGARCVPTISSPIPSNVYFFRRPGRKSCSAGSKINYSTDRKRRRRSQVFVISKPRFSFCLYLNTHTHREPVKTVATSVAVPHRSIHQSQHRTKSSIQGNGDLVLSRQCLHRMEVYWLPLVGSRKTCVLFSTFRARAS
jgi:archaellum component FlaC